MAEDPGAAKGTTWFEARACYVVLCPCSIELLEEYEAVGDASRWRLQILWDDLVGFEAELTSLFVVCWKT